MIKDRKKARSALSSLIKYVDEKNPRLIKIATIDKPDHYVAVRREKLREEILRMLEGSS